MDPGSEGGGGWTHTPGPGRLEELIPKFLGLFLGLVPAAPPSSQPHLRAWKGPRCLGAQPEGAKDKEGVV